VVDSEVDLGAGETEAVGLEVDSEVDLGEDLGAGETEAVGLGVDSGVGEMEMAEALSVPSR
jgi:predicted nucleic acid-binding protein